VLAKSFARIFYRNAFNLGLPLIECNTAKIRQGDEIDVDIDKGIVTGPHKQYTLRIKPFTKFQKGLIDVGGIVNYYKKYGKLSIES
jgi:3-isopropylmalate/(R)-2-methylmalate dehydratase small subunit